MSNMSVREARRRREQLAEEIREMIADFEHDTGLAVDEVEVVRLPVDTHDERQSILNTVRIYIEL